MPGLVTALGLTLVSCKALHEHRPVRSLSSSTDFVEAPPSEELSLKISENSLKNTLDLGKQTPDNVYILLPTQDFLSFIRSMCECFKENKSLKNPGTGVETSSELGHPEVDKVNTLLDSKKVSVLTAVIGGVPTKGKKTPVEISQTFLEKLTKPVIKDRIDISTPHKNVLSVDPIDTPSDGTKYPRPEFILNNSTSNLENPLKDKHDNLLNFQNVSVVGVPTEEKTTPTPIEIDILTLNKSVSSVDTIDVPSDKKKSPRTSESIFKNSTSELEKPLKDKDFQHVSMVGIPIEENSTPTLIEITTTFLENTTKPIIKDRVDILTPDQKVSSVNSIDIPSDEKKPPILPESILENSILELGNPLKDKDDNLLHFKNVSVVGVRIDKNLKPTLIEISKKFLEKSTEPFIKDKVDNLPPPQNVFTVDPLDIASNEKKSPKTSESTSKNSTTELGNPLKDKNDNLLHFQNVSAVGVPTEEKTTPTTIEISKKPIENTSNPIIDLLTPDQKVPFIDPSDEKKSSRPSEPILKNNTVEIENPLKDKDDNLLPSQKGPVLTTLVGVSSGENRKNSKPKELKINNRYRSCASCNVPILNQQ